MTRGFGSSILALALVFGIAGLVRADRWTAPSAITTLSFNPDILRDLGVEITERRGGPSFETVSPSLLTFRAPRGDFERFDAGALHHDGGFVLTGPGGRLQLDPIILQVSPGDDDFDWLDATGRRWFVLRDMHFRVSLESQELRLLNVSIHMAPEFARWLGRDDLAWSFVGAASIRLPALIPPAVADGGSGAGECMETVGLPVDVELTNIGQVSQLAREAGVRVAVAPSAELENVGQGSVEWYRAISPSVGVVGPHPYLNMAMYRLDADGRLVQLGLADVKHAFFATNSGCPCPGAQILYPGCGDVYGVTTNANRLYLGPREEVTAFTGEWERVGSHFDQCLALQPPSCDPVTDDADDFRDHQGDTPASFYHDSFEHRLVVPEPELQTPGAVYFIEAWYVTEGDVDLFNSLGRRAIDPQLSGSVWSFNFDGVLVHGSVLDEIPGAERQTLDTGEGLVDLAVTTADLGGGVHHYRYALLNFDFDRQIDRFDVPIGAGLTVTNADSSGLGDDPANDWTVTIGSDTISWEAPGGTGLDWGMFQRFEFDVDAAPVPSEVSLSVLESGAPTFLTAAVVAPVPEPSPHLMLSVGVLTLAVLRHRRGILPS